MSATSLDLTATCTPDDNANANTNGFNGSGDVCTKLWITVQEWPDNTYTGTPVACVYGNAAVTDTCDFSGTPPAVERACRTASPTRWRRA